MGIFLFLFCIHIKNLKNKQAFKGHSLSNLSLKVTLTPHQPPQATKKKINICFSLIKNKFIYYVRTLY